MRISIYTILRELKLVNRQTDVTNKHVKTMDTGDLSEETYRAIMIEAERFNHDLTLQFGLLSGNCKGENDFIEQSIHLIDEVKIYDEIDLDDMFLGNPPKMSEFQTALKRIFDNIVELIKILTENRTYD